MATETSLGPIDIAISGMKSHDRSISAIVSNVANYQTTDAGNGEPYRRIEAKLKAMDNGGVEVDELTEDMSDFKTLFKPGHPNADPNGYVRMPNVDLPTAMINLTTATRAYQANAAVLKRYQQIVENTLELLR